MSIGKNIDKNQYCRVQPKRPIMNNQEPSSFEPGEQLPSDLSQGSADMQPQQSSADPSLPPGEYRQLDPAIDRPVGPDRDHILPTTQPETYRVRGPYLGSDWQLQPPIRRHPIQNGLTGLIILMLLVGSVLSVTIYNIVTNMGDVS